jgi:hypothetical protein
MPKKVEDQNEDKDDNMSQTMYAIVIALVMLVVVSFAVKTSWNYVAPSVFGLKDISVYQAFAMYALVRIMLGGLNQCTTYYTSIVGNK